MAASGLNRSLEKARRSNLLYPGTCSMNNSRRAHILIVEDNDADIVLFRVIQAAGIVFDLSRFTDGQDCIGSLAAWAADPTPDLIIIDLTSKKSRV